MIKLDYEVGYSIYRSENGPIECIPIIFVSEDLNLLITINGYSLVVMREFVNGLKSLLNGSKIWNGDDYDYCWSGGELVNFISNEESTIVVGASNESTIEVSTIEIYDLLLDRLRLMESYPKGLVQRIILSELGKTKSADIYTRNRKRVKLANVDVKSIGKNVDAIRFDEKYFG
jgi:hypothetical protein